MSATTINDSLIAGSLSGVVTRFLGSPLDLLKVRLQLQIEPTSSVKVGFAVIVLMRYNAVVV